MKPVYDNHLRMEIKTPLLPVSCSAVDAGSVLKVVSITQENWSNEEVVLEELQVFQVWFTTQPHTHTVYLRTNTYTRCIPAISASSTIVWQLPNQAVKHSSHLFYIYIYKHRWISLNKLICFFSLTVIQTCQFFEVWSLFVLLLAGSHSHRQFRAVFETGLPSFVLFPHSSHTMPHSVYCLFWYNVRMCTCLMLLMTSDTYVPKVQSCIHSSLAFIFL